MGEVIYPKTQWPVLKNQSLYRIFRYCCGKCGFDSRVMKLTAERHYWRCQHGIDWKPEYE
jgi:hypothetical protein